MQQLVVVNVNHTQFNKIKVELKMYIERIHDFARRSFILGDHDSACSAASFCAPQLGASQLHYTVFRKMFISLLKKSNTVTV